MPARPPSCTPSKRPEIDRSGPASGPLLALIESVSGASIGRIVFRFAAIQPGRSTSSRAGSSSVTSRPLYAPTLPANSRASGSTDAARTPPNGGEPAISSPIRCAVPQSITSIH